MITTKEIVPLRKNQKKDEDASFPVFFKRFTEVAKLADAMQNNHRKLYRASLAPKCFDMTVEEAEALVASLGNGDDAPLQALWPGVDIYHPSIKHMAERLSMLVGSFPNAGPHSPEIFASMMVAYVAAEEPSMMVLESACRQLVETQKFVPAISEVLEAIREQHKKWKKKLEVNEAVRNGRVKEMGDKLIEGLRKRDQGDTRVRVQLLPYDHPDHYELDKVWRRYSRAFDMLKESEKASFRGLTDKLEEEISAMIRVENMERERERSRPPVIVEGVDI